MEEKATEAATTSENRPASTSWETRKTGERQASITQLQLLGQGRFGQVTYPLPSSVELSHVVGLESES